ncbi:MAG: cystathionine beta-lyase [Proteobacteria bacterium]|nr:cystathionine beta-lyase [Pseudomonadota bacterium]
MTRHWRTRLLHTNAHVPEGFKSLATPVYRGSTVLFDRQADVADQWHADKGYAYGLYGTPTVLELGARVAELEQARHSFVVPGGQAAIALTYLASCKAGSHALVPWNAYGPNREMGEGLLRALNIEVEAYDPMLGSGIGQLIRPNTALIWCESPGSVTMEIQDLPAIVGAAHERGVTVALDNSYAAGVLLDAFAMGVDISIQAITKYIGGHSDVLLGTVSVRDERTYETVGSTWAQLGMAVSPDDCSLALRGLQTLGVRLERLERSALELARWLADRPEIACVLHPALPSCPGHDIWQRDFAGSASIFSIVFEKRYSKSQVASFIDALELFQIGFSWGGVASLAVSFPDLKRPGIDYEGRLVRLNIGLEEVADLRADLEAAFRKL